jgi:hypothetical protein
VEELFLRPRQDNSEGNMVEVKTVKIESVKIKIGKNELELSIEEARQLKKELDEVLGKEIVTKEYVPYYPYWYVYPQPYTTYTLPKIEIYPTQPKTPEITWFASSGGNYQASYTINS